jgi:flagellin
MLSLDTDASATAALAALPSILPSGLGVLADADMAAESAKLAALQIRQQLAIQTPMIAERQPQVLFSLFRFRND